MDSIDDYVVGKIKKAKGGYGIFRRRLCEFWLNEGSRKSIGTTRGKR